MAKKKIHIQKYCYYEKSKEEWAQYYADHPDLIIYFVAHYHVAEKEVFRLTKNGDLRRV